MLDENRNSDDDDGYKSPLRKLVKFFEKSRDNWKTKCQEAKYKVKMLQNKVRYLEKRKEELNKRVKELEKELQQDRKKKL
ncbi:hypothetical protein [Desulfococcus sp.]|uniref:hypothetical protein n=1 Tax=Desulfococcus sp. TaxID=2025834 RepID=UPI0035948F07